MRKLSIVGGSIGAMALAAVIGACSEEPVSRLPPRPSPLALSAIEISGPDRLPPGQSAQFTAIIRLSDGTRKTASTDTNVQWTTSNGQVLRVTTAGLVTAQHLMGDATLRASVARGGPSGGVLQSAREVVILPDGTFRVAGMVRDAELPTVPVFGARIEVTPGGLTTLSNFDGRYTLYGVPAEAEVKISRDGYLPSVQNLRLTGNVTQDFELALSAPRGLVFGNYTLAVDVTGTCTTLPSDLQHRRYDAVVTQNGANLEVTLTEPRFRVSNREGNRFSGRIDGTGATFYLNGLGYYYYYYPSVVEQLPNGTVLVTEGQVSMKGTASGMSGQILPYGAVTNWDSGFPRGRSLGSCFNQSAIVLSLTPR